MGHYYNQNEARIKKLKEKKDYSALRQVANKGAEVGDEECLELIGEDYYYGRSIITDYAKAFYYFKKATENDTPKSWYHLGLCYWFAEGVKRDTKKAIECMHKETEDDRDRAYFLYAMTILQLKDENNKEKIKQIMEQMYETIYKEYSNHIAAFSYAVYLIQGEAFPDSFDPCKAGVPEEDKAKGMKILEEISKKCYDRGYSSYYLSLIYAGGMPPVVSSNEKLARNYLNTAAKMECFPAAHTKSELFMKNRDTKIVYFYKGDAVFIGNKYGRVDDAIDKLSLIIANSHVHEFDRDMMVLHSYAQFEVDMEARITQMYGKDPLAVILTKGPTMKKYVKGIPQPLYEVPEYNPVNAKVSHSSDSLSSGKSDQIGSITGAISDSLKNVAKNVDVNAVADAAENAVNKAAEKVKGLFGKFKK